jgi:DNA-binding transcriptional regulator YhcF (GntR family)
MKTRDRRTTNWFWCSNLLVDELGPTLGPIALAVYVCLARHANENGTTWPAKRTIATEIRASTRAVQYALRQLESAGAITTDHDPTRTTNTYTLLDPPWEPHQAETQPVINELWSRTLQQLQGQMTRATYQTWLAPTTASIDPEGQTLIVHTSSAQATDWLHRRLRAKIEAATYAVAGHELVIYFQHQNGANHADP